MSIIIATTLLVTSLDLLSLLQHFDFLLGPHHCTGLYFLKLVRHLLQTTLLGR